MDQTAARLAALQKGEAVYKQFAVEIQPLEDRRVRFTITTNDPDRERDVVDPAGIDVEAYQRNPVVLFGHDYKSLPIGRCIAIERHANKLVATAEFATADLNPMAEQVFRMVKAGFLKATSIGFRPLEWTYDEVRKGVDFIKSELLEFSVVPVPANAMALIAMGQAGIDTAVLKDWARRTLEFCEAGTETKVEPGADGNCPEGYEMGDDGMCHMPMKATIGARRDDPVRWNRSLSKAFDVDEEPLEASRLEYTWVSRFLGTPIKDIYETTVHVSSPRMGAFLTALDDSLARYKTDAVRNMTRHDKEVPPVYENIRLNSTLSRSFLVEGLRFVSGPAKMVAKVQPDWSGLSLTMYIARSGQQHVLDFLAATGQKAREYKFLRGEAFALSGEFLQRDGTSLDGVFLEEKNIGPVRRIAALVNERGVAMEARGAILMGPPGTGKTLAARALMNEAKDATYIWVSQRDIWRAGMHGGITLAFDLARENAPSIVLFEDIDDAVGQCTDLLKSELDGLQTQRGVVTLLTTNFPELLPRALIDRPGRFHDVLQFDVPSDAIRRRMLDAWAPEAPADVRVEIAAATKGFSGAHLRELVRFAETIKSQDGLDLAAAMRQALEKVKAQRALIDQLHAQPNRWRQVRPPAAKALYKGGHGTCDRCGADGQALCVGVCASCAEALHPWCGEAATARVAQLSRKEIMDAAMGDAPAGPFERDLVGHKAFVAARRRLERRGVFFNEAVVADLLEDYGFEPEAAVLRHVEAPRLPADADVDAWLKARGCVAVSADLWREVTVQKVGRVLSRANETRLREGRARIDEGCSMVDDVLRAVEQMPEDVEQDAVLALDADGADGAIELSEDGDGDGDALVLLADDPEPDAVEVDADLIAAAVRSAFVGLRVDEIVKRETRAAVNALRGRID